MKTFNQCCELGEETKKAKEATDKANPQCNSKWTRNEGGYFWCEGDRVPRQDFDSTKSEGERVGVCRCYDKSELSIRGPELRLIPGCHEDATRCDDTEAPVTL